MTSTTILPPLAVDAAEINDAEAEEEVDADRKGDDFARAKAGAASSNSYAHERYHRHRRELSATTSLFRSMVHNPWPYMLFLPAVFIVLICFGWSRDDIVENEVTHIWIPQSGSYANDVKYARRLGRGDRTTSSFAAMAIARDGKNLFTTERLEEIRSRMEATESISVRAAPFGAVVVMACSLLNSESFEGTHNVGRCALRLCGCCLLQIEFKGNTYRWEDFCASNGGYPYEFPCLRLSPMDLFQEARWFFDYNGPESVPAHEYVPAPKQDLYRRTWYNELIRKLLVAPRIPRFGVMTTVCAPACQFVLGYRLTPDSPGYSPFSLFADIGNLVRYIRSVAIVATLHRSPNVLRRATPLCS